MMNENNENLNAVSLTEEELEAVAGGKATYVVATAEANIRSGPGKQYPVVGTTIIGFDAKYLNKMEKDSSGRNWAKVSWNNKTGWICTKYIRKK